MYHITEGLQSFFLKFAIDVGGQLRQHTAVYHQLRAGGISGGIATQIPDSICNIFKSGNITDGGVVGKAMLNVIFVPLPAKTAQPSCANRDAMAKPVPSWVPVTKTAFFIRYLPICNTAVFKILPGCGPRTVVELILQSVLVQFNAQTRLGGHINITIVNNKGFGDITHTQVALVRVAGCSCPSQVIFIGIPPVRKFEKGIPWRRWERGGRSFVRLPPRGN